MDVCAFVGVAPRGPARLPDETDNHRDLEDLLRPDMPKRRSVAVPVESWDEYLRLFGGFEGPGRLPYAVAAFFEQGGRRAYIVRIVHEYADSENPTAEQLENNNGGVAEAILPKAVSDKGDLGLRARNEGRWGDGLRASLGFSVSPIPLLPGTSASELVIDEADVFPAGSLLRLTIPGAADDPPARELRFVGPIRERGDRQSGRIDLGVELEASVSDVPEAAELVEGVFKVADGAGMLEEWDRIGLSADHPRWLAEVLFRESNIVYPHREWVSGRITPETPDFEPFSPSFQASGAIAAFSGGKDRYGDIEFGDFFDDSWDLLDDRPGDGVQALGGLADLSAVVVPDLYVPEPLPQREDIRDYPSLAGSEFEPCVDVETDLEEMGEKVPELEQLYLDPLLPDDLNDISELQEKLAEFAENVRNFVVLLDVPPGLNRRRIFEWRARFRSSYLAAYHPWLRIDREDDERNELILLNPSAVAAGIIAEREIRFGVPHGPANFVAKGVVKLDESVSPSLHAELHRKGINVYLRERDGAWLSAGRTLSRDVRYRQLSVRRLVMMLKRTLFREMQWTVFEPNGPALWREVRLMLTNYLRRLYSEGAFRGKSEEEAFFVRCDGSLNSRREIDAGRMLCEVGIAPAEPLEFIVVRITRGGDGTLTVENPT